MNVLRTIKKDNHNVSYHHSLSHKVNLRSR